MTTNKASKFFGVINTQAVYIGDHKLRTSDVPPELHLLIRSSTPK